MENEFGLKKIDEKVGILRIWHLKFGYLQTKCNVNARSLQKIMLE